MGRGLGGIGWRIAATALVVAAVSTTILALGVVIVGGQAFADLMSSHGESVDASRAMYEDSVVRVLLLATVVAVGVAVLLAVVMGRRLAQPLRHIGAAARGIAEGDYRGRVPREGPEEIVSLADSFNQMAIALEEQERMRREFITNAAHELRTPLTNLMGYLEALRDGVIPADQAAYESLLEEAERLVRLARSLDTLTEVERPPADQPVEVDLTILIRAAVELAQPGMRTAGLGTEVRVPQHLPARGDPDTLAQVLGNLLQNATRYTPSGGRVTITGERRPGDVLVSVTNT
ncbi:MAG: HAMP domain-containing protein, partial [Chloroflexi bacterium]|nr:HAMP domain-containing protein [Chloroflexota bacterium]